LKKLHNRISSRIKSSIREQSPGQYSIILDWFDPSSGKRMLKQYFLAGSKEQAQIERRKVISDLVGNTGAIDSKINVGQLFERWLHSVKAKVSPRTHERYAEIARHNLSPLIGQIPLKNLTQVTVSEAYAMALESGRLDGTGGLAPQTVRHMHRVLHQAMSQAARWRLISENPLDSISPPKASRAAFNVYDLSETRALLAAMRGTNIFMPVLLSVLVGMRRSEISALRWSSIDIDGGLLSVSQAAEQMNNGHQIKALKKSRTRMLSLGPSITRELRYHWIAQQCSFLKAGIHHSIDQFVCAHADGRMMQPTWITHEWLRVIRGTQLPNYRFDDLRHTHAVHLLASGVSPTIASQRLGYSRSGEMLDFYCDFMPNEREGAKGRIDALHEGLVSPSRRD
jgi:integrase